jgi:hypothetical protein
VNAKARKDIPKDGTLQAQQTHNQHLKPCNPERGSAHMSAHFESAPSPILLVLSTCIQRGRQSFLRRRYMIFKFAAPVATTLAPCSEVAVTFMKCWHVLYKATHPSNASLAAAEKICELAEIWRQLCCTSTVQITTTLPPYRWRHVSPGEATKIMAKRYSCSCENKKDRQTCSSKPSTERIG